MCIRDRLSPAASGKSIAQTGRYLLEEIHSEILATSESMMKNYQTVHSNWQSECQKQKKKGDACSEEPQRPPFKMLFIPATTSYTRMHFFNHLMSHTEYVPIVNTKVDVIGKTPACLLYTSRCV